jgi:hypothetical protein
MQTGVFFCKSGRVVKPLFLWGPIAARYLDLSEAAVGAATGGTWSDFWVSTE